MELEWFPWLYTRKSHEAKFALTGEGLPVTWVSKNKMFHGHQQWTIFDFCGDAESLLALFRSLLFCRPVFGQKQRHAEGAIMPVEQKFCIHPMWENRKMCIYLAGNIVFLLPPDRMCTCWGQHASRGFMQVGSSNFFLLRSKERESPGKPVVFWFVLEVSAFEFPRHETSGVYVRQGDRNFVALTHCTSACTSV